MPKSQTTLIPTIGLEIHVELKTNSKMFCGCPADHFGKAPNTQTCPVCLGLPGALPVPNRKAIEHTLLIGLALHCQVSGESKFDRKHYFYPDLPKGYQISQYDDPLCTAGWLETTQGRVGISRVHLEEDTGKLLHTKIEGEDVSLVDFNRSGVPLVEIVTQPDIHSAEQAKEFSQKLRTILRYLGISDCDMEKGSLRLEANVSWGTELGYKVEVKNLNSFRFVKRAIDYELIRQRQIIDAGDTPKQETRGWSESDGATKAQRFKETASDYRYFPEPDIPPIRIGKALITGLRRSLPELPDARAQRFQSEYGLKEREAQLLAANKDLSEYASQALEFARGTSLASTLLSNTILNRKIDIGKTTPKKLVDQLLKQSKNRVVDKQTLARWAMTAIQELPKAVADYRAGKTQALAALIGQVMRYSQGTADANAVRRILEETLRTTGQRDNS